MKQGWEIKKLGDVATILDNQRKPVTKKDRCNGIYPYYGASGVQDYVDKYIFDGRYLLVGEDGAKWGASDKSAYIVDGKCWVNNHAHILKLDNSINDKMVEYYLVYKDLSEYITGAIVPKLTQQALKQIPIPVPERAEQERIVGELDCLSGIIAAKRAQLRELDTLAQSIFYTMFGDPITNDKGWQTKKLGEITEQINGLWVGKNPPFVTIAVIRNTNFTKDCNLDTNNIAYIQVEQKQYSTRKLKCGDIIIEKSGGSDKQPVGRPILFNIEDGEYSFSNFTSVLRVVDNTLISPKFLHKFLVYIYNQGYTLNMQSKTTGIRNLNFKLYKNMNIPIPPIALQNEFAEKIENIERQKELITKSIKETEDLFNSRMSYYFD